MFTAKKMREQANNVKIASENVDAILELINEESKKGKYSLAGYYGHPGCIWLTGEEVEYICIILGYAYSEITTNYELVVGYRISW